MQLGLAEFDINSSVNSELSAPLGGALSLPSAVSKCNGVEPEIGANVPYMDYDSRRVYWCALLHRFEDEVPSNSILKSRAR